MFVKILPRWVVFLLDIVFSGFALFFSYIVKQSMILRPLQWDQIMSAVIVLTLINTVVFLSLKTYAGIVRYTSTQDLLRIALALIISSLSMYFLKVSGIQFNGSSLLSSGILIVYFSFSLMILFSYRVIVKFSFSYFKRFKANQKPVFIFGAGEAGLITYSVLKNDPYNVYRVIAFVDDNSRKIGNKVYGIPVVSMKRLPEMLKKHSNVEMILSAFNIPQQRKNEIVDLCLEMKIKVLSIPHLSAWREGAFKPRELKSIQIEDLLERDPILIHNEEIVKQIKGKRILITGAAGSIGSEIVRQLLNYDPGMLVLCDHAETPLCQLDLELTRMGKHEFISPLLADITDKARMRDVFERYRPEIVYHAAAYKHVPILEIFPSEAIGNNTLGTRNVADLAVEFGVDRFVMISTDKAVNPANVMGASKRLAEMYVQSLASSGKYETCFITTRFGNVLGSNGSVVNLFKDQIAKGGPVTVTHPEINRFFMTIQEACSLVLEAGCMGLGGEVFVFDMGKPVKIMDMAIKMIRLYGLEPHRDIPIVCTQLRPGEKLYEELLIKGENILDTYHEKIKIAKVNKVCFEEIDECLTMLQMSLENGEKEERIVQIMKEQIPEFQSNNSIFEVLDK